MHAVMQHGDGKRCIWDGCEILKRKTKIRKQERASYHNSDEVALGLLERAGAVEEMRDARRRYGVVLWMGKEKTAMN